MGFRKVAILTPYMKPLTQQVATYIESEDIEVTDTLSLEVSDDLEVGRLDPMNLLEHVKRLDTSRADASNCPPVCRCPRCPGSSWSRTV
jgi:maleate isomerase